MYLKGKEHKKYEFGNKSCFAITKTSGIVVGTLASEDNIYDGHAIEPQLEQVEDLIGRLPETVLVDRGCKGRNSIIRKSVISVLNELFQKLPCNYQMQFLFYQT